MILLAIAPPAAFLFFNAALSFYASSYVIFPALSIMAALDVFFRAKDYNRLRNLRSVTRGHLRMFRHSLCSRFSCAAASGRFMGVMSEYRAMGYRWYHVLPDGFLTLGKGPLSSRFWRSFTGIKRG